MIHERNSAVQTLSEEFCLDSFWTSRVPVAEFCKKWMGFCSQAEVECFCRWSSIFRDKDWCTLTDLLYYFLLLKLFVAFRDAASVNTSQLLCLACVLQMNLQCSADVCLMRLNMNCSVVLLAVFHILMSQRSLTSYTLTDRCGQQIRIKSKPVLRNPSAAVVFSNTSFNDLERCFLYAHCVSSMTAHRTQGTSDNNNSNNNFIYIAHLKNSSTKCFTEY